MELTFLNSCDGKVIKRRQSRRACPVCRHKKKRCYHNSPRSQGSSKEQSPNGFDAINASRANLDGLKHHPAIIGASAAQIIEERNASLFQQVEEQVISGSNISDAPSAAEDEESSPRHFACDSNPVVTFLEEQGSRLRKGQSQRGDVGAWLRNEDAIPLRQQRCSSSQSAPNGLHQPTNVCLLPPKEKQDALTDIYFRRIHPILPLVNEPDLQAQIREGTLSPQLMQSICLVASKDRSAAPFLCLGQDSRVLTFKEYSNLLYRDIMQSITRKVIRKKVTTIQILAMLSLHEWGPTGFEDCSLNLMQAIHHAHTIGLHLVRPDQQSDPSLKALFWCLWSLDRWNAAMNGRPVMILDRDMGQKLEDVFPLFNPPFSTWLRLTEKLGEVIQFYRPVVDDIDEQELDLPSFEDLVDSSNAWDIPLDILGSLDMFYHGVIILSSHSKGLQGRSRQNVSRIRQSHSIFSIASICRKQNIWDLVPVPMAAYILSLAFSITYRQLRDEKLQSAQETAKEHIHLFHECLTILGSTWWSAAVMARLGNCALTSIQLQTSEEQSTESGLDQIGSGSQDMTNPLLSQQPLSDAYHSSRSSVGPTQLLEQSEATYMEAEPVHHRRIGSVLSPNIHHILDTPDMMSGNIEDFDFFLDNFSDINLPRPYGDQFFLDLNIPDS